MRKNVLLTLVVFALSLTLSVSAFANAKLTIFNADAGTGKGFDDPTPAATVGGNTGTTVGQQRLNVFNYVAGIWGQALDSASEIKIYASFAPLSCTATAGTLGGTSVSWWEANFPGAAFTNTWYHVTLASKLAGVDLESHPEDPLEDSDMIIQFNGKLGSPGCLETSHWYYGLDENEAPGDINLATVTLHEMGHGLGMSAFFNQTNGSLNLGIPDVYQRNLFDNALNKTFDQMSNTERRNSVIDPRGVVWIGSNVTGAIPNVLRVGTPLLSVNSPVNTKFQIGGASWGTPVAAPGITGTVVLGIDPADVAGPTITDGCSPFTNAAALNSKIALVDRGTCGFVVKAKNAQDAGAIAIIIADNVAGGPPADLGGADPTLTITGVRVTLADGTTLKGLIAGGLNATIGVDQSVRAGSDVNGHALLYTPNPRVAGSSISHWDTVASPDQLMEPNSTPTMALTVEPPRDLTLMEMRDVGWYEDRDIDNVADAGDQCLGSDLRGSVIIGGINTGVTNKLFATGCTITDLVNKCSEGAKNHGQAQSCVADITKQLLDGGFINPPQQGAIRSAAAKTN
jgi:PA domain-containing protein